MSHAIRPWLPAGAIQDGTLAAVLTEHTRRWAQRWFCAPSTPSARMQRNDPNLGIPRDAICWEAPPHGLLLMDMRAQSWLAERILGAPVTLRKATDNDRRLLAELAGRCVEDFCRGLRDCFSLEPSLRRVKPPRAPPIGYCFSISLGPPNAIFYLHLPPAAAIAARRAILAPAHPPSRSPAPRYEAILRQPIRVGAMVGVSRLALVEFRSLATGDVLVLDRGSGDGVALTIDGEAKPDVTCDLFQVGSHLHLRLARFEGEATL